MIRHITIFRMKNSCSSEHGKLCFGLPEIISGTPKQLAARLKAREGSTPKSLRLKAEKQEQELEK